MKITEKIIQEYIWENKNNLYNLFDDVEFPKLIEKEKPWDLTPSEVVFNMIITKYKKLWDEIRLMQLFGCEVPLKKDNDNTIRADFLASFEGINGIGIIELKKSNQAERQSFTELLGYGSHIKTVFAPMGKLDITYILIAPMQERIVRESVINQLYYEQINTFAIIPEWKNDDIGTLNLKPWIPSLVEVEHITKEVFFKNNFVIFKVVWDGLIGDWSPKEKGENPTQDMIDKMNIVSSYTSQIMEERGINGFCYTSQDYSEYRDNAHLINAINIVGLNPYKATRHRYIINTIPKEHRNGIDNIDSFSVKMNDIIPEIKNNYYQEGDTEDIFKFLESNWSEAIIKIGFEVVETLTKSRDNKSIETSFGIFSWSNFQNSWYEHIMVHNFNVHPTGLMRRLYWEYSKLDYDYIAKYGCEQHPMCFETDDIPKYIVDIMENHYMFNNFMERLSQEYCEDI